MDNINLIGKRYSKACRDISKATGIKIFRGLNKPEIIINYGLTGKKLEYLFHKYPTIKNSIIINRYIGKPKHLVIKEAEDAGVLVPDTRLFLPNNFNLKDWIEKRKHSSQGIGIKVATKRCELLHKYYQKIIKDRLYELRVHSFLWLPKEQWKVDKRIGPADQIAWNFHQGGHFQSVINPNRYKIFLEAKDIAERILNIRKMAFGAVDMVVDKKLNIYFIEINSSPGFSDLNKGVYFEAFLSLKNLSINKIKRYGE